MFFVHRPKNIRLTKKTRIRITFYCMLYNFYLKQFYMKQRIKKNLGGRLDSLQPNPTALDTVACHSVRARWIQSRASHICTVLHFTIQAYTPTPNLGHSTQACNHCSTTTVLSQRRQVQFFSQ